LQQHPNNHQLLQLPIEQAPTSTATQPGKKDNGTPCMYALNWVVDGLAGNDAASHDKADDADMGAGIYRDLRATSGALMCLGLSCGSAGGVLKGLCGPAAGLQLLQVRFVCVCVCVCARVCVWLSN